MIKAKCVQCERRKETFLSSRLGGGSYKRAPRSYRSRVCIDCARDLLANAGQQWRVDGWDVVTLRFGLKRAGHTAPGKGARDE